MSKYILDNNGFNAIKANSPLYLEKTNGRIGYDHICKEDEDYDKITLDQAEFLLLQDLYRINYDASYYLANRRYVSQMEHNTFVAIGYLYYTYTGSKYEPSHLISYDSNIYLAAYMSKLANDFKEDDDKVKKVFSTPGLVYEFCHDKDIEKIDIKNPFKQPTVDFIITNDHSHDEELKWIAVELTRVFTPIYFGNTRMYNSVAAYLNQFLNFNGIDNCAKHVMTEHMEILKNSEIYQVDPRYKRDII
jgi:hypothetical protein